ncbi:MAG: DUF885 family protein [Longimicrobiales bacterium]
MSWLDRFFRSYYAHRPVNATFIGVHDTDAQLPDFSENGAGDALADIRALLEERDRVGPEDREPNGVPLEGHDPPYAFPAGEGGVPGVAGAAATDWEALDRRLGEGFLRIQRWEYESHHFHRGNPSLYTGEAVFGMMSLLLTDFAPLEERLEAMTARMATVPELLVQGRENVREAPRAWTERAIGECTGALAFLDRGIVGLPLKGRDEAADLPVEDRSGTTRRRAPAALTGWDPGAAPSSVALRLHTAAGEAAHAFRGFQEHLESHLRRHASDRYGCGEEAFALCMREGHFLERDPDEILAYARDELAEAAARVAEHPRFTPEDLAGLADLHPSVDGYYAAYQEAWDAVRERAEEQDLLTWPEFPIRYVPRPPWSREAAQYLYFLFYRSPPAFHRPPVHDYLVTPVDASLPPERQEELLRANNDGVIKLNHVIHHGSIGHHVQNWHAFHSPSRIGQVAAVDCASRIAMFCGGTMAEGWACYATDLMAEAGALTPLEEYAELKGRTRMCARAIVDVQLHRGRMTMEEAARFYEDRAGMGREAAMAEAVKNSMFPGAAVIYLLGRDAIHALRRDLSAMAARRGRTFRLRGFHDEFLSHGSIPVALIAGEMKRKYGPDQ